jgi:cell pole-organizing protein PopZ
VNGTWPPAGTSPLQGSQALEVMVLDLLKPMLREWLDQNMPRMVAEALKAESDRVGAGGSAKKP